MNGNFLTPRRVVLGVLSITVAAILVIQWNTLSTLRDQNGLTLAGQSDTRMDSSPHHGTELSPGERHEMERLRQENQGLHKLRNEIAQLKKQRQELEAVRTENQRLLQTKNEREQLKRIDQLPGYVPKTSWRDAGFQSPETTVQTLFWSLAGGKLERVLDCMSSSEKSGMGKPSEKERQEQVELMSHVKGYRIAEKRALTEDEVLLSVQAPIFGDSAANMPMKRIDGEWKISGRISGNSK